MPDEKLTAFNRILAITDVETTGLDWDTHEILEIGLVKARQDTLETLEEWEVKVHPEHIEIADPRSLEINGYSAEEWKEAVPLSEAMRQYASRVRDCLFVAHPLTVDFNFIDRAFKKTGVLNPMDYHQLDLFSMAWALKREDTELPNITLHALTEYFDLEQEPVPHRAIGGSRLAHEILKKLVR